MTSHGTPTHPSEVPATHVAQPLDSLSELQRIIERTFGRRDRARGVATSVAWLCEEVGELAQAIRKGTPAQQRHEFADVVAWVVSLANQMDVDLAAAVGERYADGCARCRSMPCTCPM
jgi:NTP pyrophosphatase (non-canonical NTP hydrolase)